MSILKVTGLTVDYRLRTSRGTSGAAARAVDDINLEVAAGETLALVGESGSGKSSIAKAVLRLVEPTSGRIEVDGVDTTALRGRALRKARPNFQMVFQDPFESIDARRTVLQTVVESLVSAGVAGSALEHEQIALRALESVGLLPAASVGTRFAHELSGGQRQRVAIAAAMVLSPKVLVADEPVSMLDVSLRAGVLRLIADLTQTGVGCLFITHDLSLAWMFADRIAVLYLGRIVEEGPAEAVIAAPNHPYTRALVSVIPGPHREATHKPEVLRGEIPDAASVPAGCAFHPRCPLYRELGEPEACRTQRPSLEGSIHRVACHQIKGAQ